MKYKEGQKVRCLSDNKNNIAPGTILTINNCFEDNKIYGFIGVPYGLYEHEIEPLTKTLETLEVGDRVFDENDEWREILAVIVRRGEKSVYLVSKMDNDLEAWDVRTAHDLEEDNYKLKEEPEVKEMTVKEVSEALGYEVKIIK